MDFPPSDRNIENNEKDTQKGDENIAADSSKSIETDVLMSPNVELKSSDDSTSDDSTSDTSSSVTHKTSDENKLRPLSLLNENMFLSGLEIVSDSDSDTDTTENKNLKKRKRRINPSSDILFSYGDRVSHPNYVPTITGFSQNSVENGNKQSNIIIVRRRVDWIIPPEYLSSSIENFPNIWKPKVLVLGPGGIKGFYYLGFLMLLEAKNYLYSVDKFVGCSVGSLISLLILCGYNILSIFEAAAETSSIFSNIESIDASQITKKAGLLSHKLLEQQLKKLIKKRMSDIPTMEEFYALTGKDFCAVTTKVPGGPVYINRFTYPKMSVVTAVMLSSNIPGVFHKLVYDQNTYIDGALTDPYPIKYHDDGMTNILGMYIESQNGDNIGGYLSNVLYSSIRRLRSMSKRSCSQNCRHIELLDKPRSLSLNIPNSDKIDMFVSGYKIGMNFYNNLIDESKHRSNNKSSKIPRNPSQYIRAHNNHEITSGYQPQDTHRTCAKRVKDAVKIHVDKTKEILIGRFNHKVKEYVINGIEKGISTTQLADIFQTSTNTIEGIKSTWKYIKQSGTFKPFEENTSTLDPNELYPENQALGQLFSTEYKSVNKKLTVKIIKNDD